MKRRTLILSFAFLCCSTVAPWLQSSAVAQNNPTWSEQDGLKIVGQVQKKLANLTNYGVFDWLTFGVHGRTIVLHGYASRPILKSDAEAAVKGIAGVEHVDNRIEVLPNSPNDDRLRGAVYNRIYTAPTLSRYNANAGRAGRMPSVARMAGGITNDPPLGYHAIHIIVKNGDVTLKGVVLNEMDVNIAGMRANSTPGTFSVDNDLIPEHGATKEK